MSKINKGKNPIKVKRELQQIMWKYAWVVRNKADMEKGLRELKKFKKVKLVIGRNLKMNEKLIAALDVRNMLPTCEMILLSALYRKESRAAHYRSDYRKTLSKWKKNIICEPTKRGIRISTKPIPKMPKEIAKLLAKRKFVETKEHHMLE